MKIYAVIIVVLMLLSGCSNSNLNPFQENAVIDWGDFVKLNGNSYGGLYQSVLKDPSAYYKMVIYVDGPIAYAFTIADDSAHVFFSPWNTRIVDDDIRKWIHR